MSSAMLAERATVALDTYVVDIAWTHDGRAIAVAGGEGAVIAIDASSEKLRSRVLGEHGMGAIAVCWQPGTRLLASSGQDSSIAIWNVDGEGALGLIQRIRPGTAWTEHLAFSPEGKILAAATGKVLSLFDTAGELIHRFEPHAATIAALSWDKPGRDLAAATQGAVILHRIEPPQFTTRRYAWPAACLTAAFSPNGKYLVTGTQDGTVHFWNLTTGKDSQMRGYGSKVTITEWSANSRFLATAAGNDVIVWDFGGKGPEGTCPLELKGHTERIGALAFQPGGPWLVSAGRDWRISLWQPGKDAVAVDAHLSSGEITAIRWSPDGQRLAVGESKGRVTVYDLMSRPAAPKQRR
jgi:WD40 repeat protein